VVDNTLSSGQNTTTYSYDPASNLATATYPNGLESTFTYDQLNRLSDASTAVSGYQYHRDANGNILTATEAKNRSVSYDYDGIDELTTETVANDPSNVNGSVSYSLDPVGNRQSDSSTLAPVTSTSTTFSADDQSQAESYDTSGDTVSTAGNSFAYNSWLKLVSMNGGQVSLAYNGLGQLVSETANSVTTKYLVDDISPTGYAQVVAEMVNGQAVRTYTYGLERISELQIVNNVSTASFYQYDGRGTVRMLTNSAGAVTDSYEYDAFGNEINHTGTTPNVYLYRGERYDSDLDLYYLRARWYNPVTGSFMTRDPYQGSIYDPASLHRYNYARSNPVNNIDPSGRASAAEYGLMTLNTVARGAAITSAGFAVQCAIYSIASANDLVGKSVGAQLDEFGLLWQGCAAKITVSQYGRAWAANTGFLFLGQGLSWAFESLGGLMEGAEQGLQTCCFAAGTKVHTDHGDVPIERIRVGDMVLSRNRTTGKQEYKRVTALTAQHRDKLIELRVEGETEPLRPSVNHPFWVLRAPSQQPAWIVADSMRVGDLVLDLKGEWRKVLSVKTLEGMKTVYNFEVDDNHDYFVGTTGFLVHNDLCLFKWDPEAGAPIDKGVPIKEGDYHLYLPWLGEGADAAQIQQNVNALLNVMAEGNPISETYIDQWTGKLLGVAPSAQDAGYLEAVERQLLEWNGWTYNPGYGEWFPPGWFGD
jgi:RHS repeat-associated protein